MIIKELIEQLSRFDENMEVVRIDNSFGYERIDDIIKTKIIDNFSKEQKEVVALQ